MALTRKLMKGMNLTDEQMDTIVEAHTDTVDALKGKIAELEEQTKDLAAVQKKLEQAEAALADAENGGWKDKYDSVKKEFEEYKNSQAEKEAMAAKETAYRELLKNIGVSDKRMDAVIRVTDLAAMELDEEGKLKESEKLTETARTEWAEFIAPLDTRAQSPRIDTGANLNISGTTRTKEDILKIKDTSERQKAWADYLKNQKGS